MHVRQTSDPFDVEAFLQKLVEILGINPRTLREANFKETIEMNAILNDTSATSSIEVAERLQTMVNTNDTRLEDNNIFIEKIEIDPSNSAYLNSDSSSDGKLSVGGIVAIAIVVPCVGLMLIAVAILAYKRKGASTSDLPKERPERPVDEESGTSSRRSSSAESSDSEPDMPKTSRKERKKIEKENRADSSNENSDVSDSASERVDEEDNAESSNSE